MAPLYSSTRHISQTHKTDVIQGGLVTPRGLHAPPLLIMYVNGSRFDVLLDAVILLCLSVPDIIFFITSLLYVGDIFCVAR